MNKDEIRKIVLKKRDNISDKKKLSTIIVNKMINLDIYKKSKVIAIYNSMKSEVDTTNIIKDALLHKKVLLPQVVDDRLEFIEINNDTSFIKSKFGILEPIGEYYRNYIDLIIVPGVAFDINLNRLGFGRGYYDKYLTNKDIYKMGICFDNQIVNELPIDKFDIKMDMIITDKRIIKKV